MKPLLEKKTKQGFALIFSVVVLSVVVTVTLAVSTIVQKSLELTSIGQQSMEAFFAADAGIECALYWDVHRRGDNKFPRSGAAAPSSFVCNEDPITTTVEEDSGSEKMYGFSVGGDFCADVVVNIDGDDTHIQSRGYSNCDSDDPTRVERGLEVFY